MSSYWIDSTIGENQYNKIDGNYECDVLIIGCGLTGLTSGYLLSKNGYKVILVDKDNIGMKTSGNSTAKITYQHNLIYDYLIQTYGTKYAKGYLDANKEAITNIKNIIDTENIECDFEYQSNYVYTTNQNELPKIQSEIKALSELGENVEFKTSISLPFKIVGALENKNQAQFHPRKYILALANIIQNNNGLIFTDSTAADVQYNDSSYTTNINEFIVKSKYVICASHYPFINFPGFYFAKMYQSTSYVIAVETNSKLFDGMYINPTEPIYSFRTVNAGDKRLLLISGADHKTGFAPDVNEAYNKLERLAKKYYPDSKVLYKWNTRDAISLDKIPYIGDFSNIMPNLYVATGFNKWGMTSSNIAANIILDKILGKENKYEYIFKSTRLKPIKNKNELGHMFSQVFKSFVTNRIKIPEEDLSKIDNDNGGIIKVDGISVGIYKDITGKIYAVNPTCTHLGCLLTWNNLDKTWDCPCHGSRFKFTGINIYDPAFKNLETYEIDE